MIFSCLSFDALEFVMWCATEGSVEHEGRPLTVLTAPMAGFYSVPSGQNNPGQKNPEQANPGRTQMRVAYVATPEEMAKIPAVFGALLKKYLAR